MPNRTRRQSSLGSGVVVHPSGIIVTNHHVIEGAQEIRIALSDGREYPSRVILNDQRVDLAVLQVEDIDIELNVLEFADSDAVAVGDLVLAIGNPFGVGQTVTSGIVSALARNQIGVGDFGFFIQTDAAINPGNSGGALIDMRGRLIGINTAIFSRSGGSNGIGFAIPANMVRAVVAAAVSGNDEFERPYIGASFEPVTSDIAEALGLPAARGALVTRVERAGPAQAGGLRPGDVVTAVNGIAVEHPDALGYRLATLGIGTAAVFDVYSGQEERHVEITLARLPENFTDDERLIEGNNPFAGARVANLSPGLADRLRIRDRDEGVVVVAVEPRSPAARFGLRPRDIVVAVNGARVSTSRELAEATANPARAWRMDIERDGQMMRQIVR